MPATACEIGVFASTGSLSVISLAIIPVETLGGLVVELSLAPVSLVLGLMISIVLAAFFGINLIVSSSVLGAIAAQLALPDVSELANGFAIIAGWATSIGFSPLITTVFLCGTIIDRPAVVVGPVWNGPV